MRDSEIGAGSGGIRFMGIDMPAGIRRRHFLSAVVLAVFSGFTYGLGEHGGVTLSSTPIIETRALTEQEQEIQDLLDSYAQAMEKRSVDLAQQAVLVGDFSTIESGYANWSWQDFRDRHLSKELQVFSNINYEMRLLAGEMQGDLGFAIYSFTATGNVEGKAEPVSMSGLATAIIERSEQGLRIHHIHSSTPRQGSAGAH